MALMTAWASLTTFLAARMFGLVAIDIGKEFRTTVANLGHNFQTGWTVTQMAFKGARVTTG